MKKLTILISFLIPFLLKSQEVFNDENRIYWNDSIVLQWEDFQAEPNEELSIAALSNIALPYTYVSDNEGVMTVEVKVCFNKSKSWSREKERNKVLLQHEQLHFDIAELHRRKIVKALSTEKFTKENHVQKLAAVIDKYWLKEYRKMQDKYDSQTNFSRSFKDQIAWMKEVESELVQLSDYKNAKVDVNLIDFD